MAYTHIHKITGTVNLSLDYVMNDKKENHPPKDDIADSISYVMNDKTGEVTYHTLTTTLNCNPAKPVETFYNLMNRFGREEIEFGNAQTKDGKPVLAWHLYQSFEGFVDPIIANEIGRKLAEELFPEFAVVISTHTNTENTHNHIELCAWSFNGQKWNQCNENYQKIRETSDRLCDEYGLSVIEHSRKQNLIKYKDEEGNIRYYEPTERKEKLRERREAGEITTDDVNSYRNTGAYDTSEHKKISQREIIKKDIDELLPVATSFEHLLQLLRDCGYSIKDKKSNEAWREHITYQPPTAAKGIRDSSLSEDGYYLRENLTKIIKGQMSEKARQESVTKAAPRPVASLDSVPYFERYEYGETDIDSINEDFRVDRDAGGRLRMVNRAEAEKKVIRDVKRCDRILCDQFDTTHLRLLIAQQKEVRKKNVVPSKEQEIQLIHRIQDSFENLRFMERNNISGYHQINRTTKSIWAQYNQCIEGVINNEAQIAQLERLAAAPERVRAIQERIDRMKGDAGYVYNELDEDLKQLRIEKELVEKHRLNDAVKVQELRGKIIQFKERNAGLFSTMEKFKIQLINYDRCVAVLSRIDREKGESIGDLIREYKSIKREGEEQANRQSAERSRRAYAQMRTVDNLAEMDWDAWYDEIAKEKADDLMRASETADQNEKEKNKKSRGGLGDE